jgi:hypothetical protein
VIELAGKKDKQKTPTSAPAPTTHRPRDNAPKPAQREQQVKSTLTQVVHRPEFTHALGDAVGAVAVGLAIAVVWRLARRRTAPIAGLVFAAVALLALRGTVGAPDDLVTGVAVLVVPTFVIELLRLAPALELAAAVPGAVLVAGAVPDPAAGWVRILVGVTIVLGGSVVGNFDHRWRKRAIGPGLAALFVAGVFACVPETKRIVVLLGAAVPLPLLGWPVPLARLGRAGSYGVVAVVLWASATDGAARPSAVVGAVACLGLMLAEPVIRTIGNRRSPLDVVPETWPAWLWAGPVVALHFALVFVGSRVAGIRPTVAEALTVVAAETVVVLAVGVGLRLWATPPLPRRHDPAG